MEFKRIDKETVRCIINEDDMKEFNIEMDDFLKNRDKIHEFLHQIVERAMEEVNYNPKNGMLAMQVMPLPGNRLAITFSEKSSAGLEDVLRQVNDALGGNKGANPDELMQQYDTMSEEEKAEAFDKFIKNTIQDATDELEEQKYRQSTSKQENKEVQSHNFSVAQSDSLQAVFRFKNLMDVEQFAKLIPLRLPIKSHLYKIEKDSMYYLVIQKARASLDNYKKILQLALEYAQAEAQSYARVAFLQEHATCLITEKALRVLAKL